MMGETETMLKIFLAEDEIVMREGIRNNIAWQEEGFEFVVFGSVVALIFVAAVTCVYALLIAYDGLDFFF